MSTGKRLAKRSIIGTRVCALGTDGLYYAGVIQNVKPLQGGLSKLALPPPAALTPLSPPGAALPPQESPGDGAGPVVVSGGGGAAAAAAGGGTAAQLYIVRFDVKRNAVGPGGVIIHLGVPQQREFRDVDLIGPGFRNILDCSLKRGQKIFVTHNGRECNGEVLEHDIVKDEVSIRISPQGQEVSCGLG